MSSILKALRRLEEEKAERLDTPVDIARDILRRPQKKRPIPAGWLLTFACMGVFGTAAGLVLFSGLGEEENTGIIPKAGASAPARVETPTSMPVAARSVPPTVVVAEPEVVEVRMSPPPASAGAGSEASAAVAPVRISSDRKPPPPTSPKDGNAQALSAGLAVSDIAFQAEREARLAIVNDLPVMEGTVIEGARVEEILADRVRFSRAGEMFEAGLKRD